MLASASSGAITGAATKTLLAVIGATDRRPKIKKITIGCSDGTPADNHVSFLLRRFSADGTGTSVTPKPIDIGDGTAVTCAAKSNYTAEPTYTGTGYGTLMELTLHQRATGVWEFPDGQEPSCPIGAANGLGIQQVTSLAKTFNVSIVFSE